MTYIVPLFPLAPANAAAPPPTFSLNYAALHTSIVLPALEQPTRSSACCSDHTSPSRLLRLPRRVCFTCLYVTTAAAPPAPTPLRRPRCARRESSQHSASDSESNANSCRALIVRVMLEPLHSPSHAKGKKKSRVERVPNHTTIPPYHLIIKKSLRMRTRRLLVSTPLLGE